MGASTPEAPLYGVMSGGNSARRFSHISLRIRSLVDAVPAEDDVRGAREAGLGVGVVGAEHQNVGRPSVR